MERHPLKTRAHAKEKPIENIVLSFVRFGVQKVQLHHHLQPEDVVQTYCTRSPALYVSYVYLPQVLIGPLDGLYPL